MIENKHTGKVAYLNTDKGYGFMEVEGYEKGVFFHAKDLRHVRIEQIRKGDIIAADDIETGERGHIARGLVLVS